MVELVYTRDLKSLAHIRLASSSLAPGTRKELFMSKQVKIVVTVPLVDASKVREALGAAGAGRQGNYQFCSYSVLGKGRFLPVAGAKPAIGEVGKPEVVEEERIEVTCDREVAKSVIAAMKAAHPYEEVAFDIYDLVDPDSL